MSLDRFHSKKAYWVPKHDVNFNNRNLISATRWSFDVCCLWAAILWQRMLQICSKASHSKASFVVSYTFKRPPLNCERFGLHIAGRTEQIWARTQQRSRTNGVPRQCKTHENSLAQMSPWKITEALPIVSPWIVRVTYFRLLPVVL